MPAGWDRREPLPSFVSLPAFLWRKVPPAGRIALVLLGLAALVATAVAIPRILNDRREADARAERQATAAAESRIERLRALVKPRTETVSGPASERLARLRKLIVAGAARRAESRILRASCEPVPLAAGERDAPGVRRLSCLAVTSEFAPSEVTSGGSIGYPYRALVDLRAGRLTYCRVFGVPGEGGLTSRQAVTVPKACGG